jgi:hypothetical protein
VLYPRYCGSLGNRTLANVFFDNLMGVSIRRLITSLMPFGSFACGPQELCHREYRYPGAYLKSYSGLILPITYYVLPRELGTVYALAVLYLQPDEVRFAGSVSIGLLQRQDHLYDT